MRHQLLEHGPACGLVRSRIGLALVAALEHEEFHSLEEGRRQLGSRVAGRAHFRLHRLAPDRVDQQIGRGVVADRDHQRGRGVERQGGALGPVLQHTAGKALVAQRHDVVPAQPAFLNRPRQRREDVELERRTQRIGLLRIAEHELGLALDRAEPGGGAAGQGGEIGGDLGGTVVDRFEVLQQEFGDLARRLGLNRDPAARQRALHADGDRRARGADRIDLLDRQCGAELTGQLRADRLDLLGRNALQKAGGHCLLGGQRAVEQLDHLRCALL